MECKTIVRSSPKRRRLMLLLCAAFFVAGFLIRQSKDAELADAGMLFVCMGAIALVVGSVVFYRRLEIIGCIGMARGVMKKKFFYLNEISQVEYVKGKLQFTAYGPGKTNLFRALTNDDGFRGFVECLFDYNEHLLDGCEGTVGEIVQEKRRKRSEGGQAFACCIKYVKEALPEDAAGRGKRLDIIRAVVWAACSGFWHVFNLTETCGLQVCYCF